MAAPRFYQRIGNQPPQALIPGRYILHRESDTKHPWEVVERWRKEDLAAIGIYELQRATVPPGQEVVSRSVEWTGTAMVERITTRPAKGPKDFFRERAQVPVERAILRRIAALEGKPLEQLLQEIESEL